MAPASTPPEPAAHHDPRTILTRPATPPDFTVRYGDHPAQIADVRLPAADAITRPLVIFIHGGFWQREFDRAHAGPLAVDLAGRGYICAALEYRRIGMDGGGWPGTFDDIADGVTELPGLIAESLGLEDLNDAGGVVLMGHSAGGQLALWAARHVAGVRGVLALAPVADLARAYALGLGDGSVGQLLGGGPGDVPDRYASADPMANLPLGVRFVVVHGERDVRVPVEVGRDYVATAVEAGDTAEFMGLPDIEHFGIIDPLSPAWPAVLSGLAMLCGAGRG